MEQGKVRSSAPESERYRHNRYGNRFSNRFSIITPTENLIFNELAEKAGLTISLGANVCFYVNKLNHAQFQELVSTIPDQETNQSLKNKITRKQQDNAPINWLSTNSFTSQGRTPCEALKQSISVYNKLDIEKEAKRVSSYGLVNMSIDFSKLSLVKADDGDPVYPFGIFFFSDLQNDFDNYQAVISCYPERKKDVSQCNFIKPFNFNSRGLVSCTGKFRVSGTFIIFYVANEIEKQEGVLYPDVTIVQIPVTVLREQSETYNIHQTGVCSIRRGSNCVNDFAAYIANDLFGFYGVKSGQYIGEILHAFGYDPVKYNYPPSLGDERSTYYGNRAHSFNKGNGRNNRRETPFVNRNNLFSYLSEINAKKEADIVLTSKEDEVKDSLPPHPLQQPSTQHKKKNNKRDKKETIPPAISEELVKENIAVETKDIREYSPQEIEAALDNSAVIEDEVAVESVAEGEPDYDAGQVTDPFYGSEVLPIDDVDVNDTQLDEESPQGENIGNEEVIEDAQNS